MNETLAAVQTALDEAQGIHLTPQKAPFPTERVQQIAHSLLDPNAKPETIRRRANKPVATVAKSFHDDYIRTNARVRNDLGFKCYLDRVAARGYCAWCTGIAGRYVYGEHPADIFRRHDNCSCTVTFENGRQRQDVWSKRSWDAKDPREIERLASRPAVMSRQQAEKLQNTALSRLTLGGERDIIEARGSDTLEQAKKRDHKIMITDTAISKIQKSEIAVYSAQKNEYIDKMHRLLLKTAMDQNESNEVGILFDFVSQERTTVLGLENSVNVFSDPNASAMVRTMNGLFLAHNHPSTQNFSYSDIGVFLMYDNIEGMSAVSNLGVIHQMVKTRHYDFKSAYSTLKDIRNQFGAVDGDADAAIAKAFLKVAKRFGIEYQ